MRLLEETDLVQGGIAGDAHFAPESARQLLLADQEPLLELGVAAGQIKENITVRGLGVMSLPAGTRLAIGEAEIEITKECEPCSRMDEIRPGLKEELVGRRGMYARVLRPGRVRRGDLVRVVGEPGQETQGMPA
jgi:MOSC domain-containing protein YiiM